jgi:glycogen(starch) synthase
VKILLVCDFFPPTPGGLEAHVQRLAYELLKRGHEIAIVTGTDLAAPLPGGALIVSTGTLLGSFPQLFQDNARQYPPPWPDAIFRRTVRDVANWWQPDVIHAHGWSAFSSYWPGSQPLVVTLHDHGLRCPKKSLLRDAGECLSGCGTRCLKCSGQPIVKRLLMAAMLGHSASALAVHTSRFIAVSQSVARRVAELGIAKPAIEVVPNFINVGNETVAAPTGPLTVLFVGPDSLHKGRAVAIDAFSRMPSGLARLHLAGSGTQVKMRGITNLGYLQGAALSQQYQTASVVLVPSVWPDPCPTVVLEAMASARPVIGSRIGGIPDLIEHGRSGLLVAPNDAAALADCLLRVLTDHRMRQQLGDGARARVVQFDSTTVIPQIEKIYTAACKTGAAR